MLRVRRNRSGGIKHLTSRGLHSHLRLPHPHRLYQASPRVLIIYIQASISSLNALAIASIDLRYRYGTSLTSAPKLVLQSRYSQVQRLNFWRKKTRTGSSTSVKIACCGCFSGCLEACRSCRLYRSFQAAQRTASCAVPVSLIRNLTQDLRISPPA